MTTSRPRRSASARPWRGDADRIGRLGEHVDADLGPEQAQLLYGSRALEVGTDQIGVAALLAEPASQLCGGGRLAGALEAGEQDDRRGLGGIRDLQSLAAQCGRQLLVDDLDDLLGRGEVLGKLGARAPRADPFDEILDDGEVDVGLEKRDPDLAEDLGNFGVAESSAAAKAREDPLETVGQGVEHGPDQVSRATTRPSEGRATDAGRCAISAVLVTRTAPTRTPPDRTAPGLRGPPRPRRA